MNSPDAEGHDSGGEATWDRHLKQQAKPPWQRQRLTIHERSSQGTLLDQGLSSVGVHWLQWVRHALCMSSAESMRSSRAVDRRKLDVNGLVASQAMEQRNQEAVQDWIFASYGSASIR